MPRGGGMDFGGFPAADSLAPPSFPMHYRGGPPAVPSSGSGGGGGGDSHPMHIRCKFGQMGHAPGMFNAPHGFCLGLNEEIIVADTYNHRIQVYIL